MVIDRFEGEYAICEMDAGLFAQIKKARILPPAQEGDVLLLKDGNYCADAAETAVRRARVRKKLDSLFARRPC